MIKQNSIALRSAMSTIRSRLRLSRRFSDDIKADGKRNSWESKWAREGYSPSWKAEVIPDEISQAVESGWFPSGSVVLDIGCGSGEIGAWLAAKCFDVLAVDFSNSAITRAKARYRERPGILEFRALDICREIPAPERFNVLIDRGCFHGIPKSLHQSYLHTLELCSVNGAHLLLFARIGKKSSYERVRDIERTFYPLFKVSRLAETNLGQVPGVAMYMIRD